MSSRTQLSPDTWIEGEYLYTTSREVSCLWTRLSAWQPDEYGEDRWRIHRDDCRPLYEYREGEPWGGTEFAAVCCYDASIKPMDDWPELLHLRAVLVCGGSADSLRAFHAWLGAGD